MANHPANSLLPITTVATRLGLTVTGRRANCFNIRAHKQGRDNTPSLVLYPEQGTFHCFGCGIHGDVIDLVCRVRNISFVDAVQWLDSQVSSSTTVSSRVSPRSTLRSSRQLSQKTSKPSLCPVESRIPDESAIEVYTELYGRCYALGEHTPAGQYLHRRGIDLSVAQKLHAVERGDANELWSELFELFPDDRLRSAGLVSANGTFLLAHHSLLVFVVHQDRPLYLFARDISGQADVKELSLIGLSCPMPFNVDVLSSRPRHVVLCEGCIDTISATQLGYTAVGIPGVTGFRDSWFELFRGVGRVTVAFDADEAGRRQSGELRTQFRKRGITADAMTPAEHKDWNELLLHTRA